jgi:hypothetical protein
MSWRDQLTLMYIDQMDIEISPSAVGTLISSPIVQDLTAIEIVKAVLFVEAGVCQTAGCAVASGG